MPAAEDCFTATGPNAAQPDTLRNPHSAASRVPSTLDRPSHNERFLNISEDIERIERFDMPKLYRTLSCTDRLAFDRWLKANAVVASIFSVSLVVMALAGAPAGPLEEATDRNAPERHKRSSQ
jgi:hypothetical protein